MLRILLLNSLMLVPMASVSQAEEEKFVSLFDGKTLEGWHGEAREYFAIKDQAMVCRKGCRGKLLTKREYSNFILRFEFKLTPGANNGLAIRAPKAGDAAYAGIELQILDNTAKKFQSLQPYQYHGSAYGIAPAKRGALKPVGEWNSQEVYCYGKKIRVTLNKKNILDVDLDEAAPGNRSIDGKDHPGLQRKQGFLGFLCHGDEVAFRNIQIKELAKDVEK